MRILLLKPSVSVSYDQVTVPPLGPLYLSAVLKKAGYTEVRVLHLDALGLGEEDIENELRAFGPDIVGLSAITAEGKSLHSLARLVKKVLPETLVVAGGPHPTGYAADCMENPAIDIAVRGEGEITFLEIVKNREAGKGFDGIRGITRRSGGEIIAEPDREFIEDLDSLPFPDWDAIDLGLYKNFVPQAPVHYKTPYMTVVTSRGCPFHCTFCHNTHGKKFRAHSANRVITELLTLKERYGFSEIEIIDDIFNWDRARTVEIMKGVITSGLKLKIYMANGVRADVLDKEVLDLFARAGVVFICAGVETATPGLQEAVRKNIKFSDLREMLDYAVEKRIFTHALFMVGFPGESAGEVINTIKFACSLKAHTSLFSFVCAYQGTELGDSLKDKSAVITPENDMSSAMSSVNFVNCSPLPAWKLILLKQLGNIAFFLNPARIFRLFRDLPGHNPALFLLLLKKFLTRTVFLR